MVDRALGLSRATLERGLPRILARAGPLSGTETWAASAVSRAIL